MSSNLTDVNLQGIIKEVKDIIPSVSPTTDETLILPQMFEKLKNWLNRKLDFKEIVYFIIDDSFLSKSGSHTAGTAYGYNHSKGHVEYGQQAVLATIQNGLLMLPFFSEMYDKKAKNFKSKIDLAILLYQRFFKFMKKKKFIVLFDSWYCCKKLIESFSKNIKWVSKLRRNRCIDVGEGWISLKNFLRSVNSWRYKSISVGGNVYWYYEFVAEVKNLGKLKLIAIKRSKNARIVSAVIVSNMLDETASVVLHHFKVRWNIEVCIKNSKQILGWSNCKVRGKNAIRRYWFILHLAHCLVSSWKSAWFDAKTSFRSVIETIKKKLKINGRRLALAVSFNVRVIFAKR
ncbi:transposase [Candidatus Micrarchaeota archaeon]|nr:transposase [Candidatus Micrarchaeota archaeon]